MPKPAFTRASPLATAAIPGHYGADKGVPGVILSVLHPLSLVMVIARSGKGKPTKAVVSGAAVNASIDTRTVTSPSARINLPSSEPIYFPLK